MDRPGHVSISYKNWSRDDQWHPLQGEDSVELFKLDENGEQIAPTSIPKLVEADWNNKNDIQGIA